MDGLPQHFPTQTAILVQRTLKSPIGCVGIGLHTGRKLRMILRPAAADSGIVFRRTDLGVDIPARFDHVVDTRLCTVMGLPDRPEIRVGTVEHLLAALVGAPISNVVVEIDGPELPILDGSAESLLFLIDCAGSVVQHRTVPTIEVARAVRVEHGDGFVELRPAPFGFEFDVSIDFEAEAIGRQAYRTRLSPEAFRSDLARARTFTLATDVEALKQSGLALGGSLDNAVVVDGPSILNPGGLRMDNEFVRHKMLDAVGDLALAGAALRGRLVSHRGGHRLNNQVLRALFADDANWRLVPAAPVPGEHTSWYDRADGAASMPALGSWQERKLPVAAAPY